MRVCGPRTWKILENFVIGLQDSQKASARGVVGTDDSHKQHTAVVSSLYGFVWLTLVGMLLLSDTLPLKHRRFGPNLRRLCLRPDVPQCSAAPWAQRHLHPDGTRNVIVRSGRCVTAGPIVHPRSHHFLAKKKLPCQDWPKIVLLYWAARSLWVLGSYIMLVVRWPPQNHPVPRLRVHCQIRSLAMRI